MGVTLTGPKLDILVLADTSVRFINTVNDHLSGLSKFSRHRVIVLDYRAFNRTETGPPCGLDRFDVVVLHYSVIVADIGGWLSPICRQRLRSYSGLKIIFIQDEYRWINKTAKGMEDCGFHVIFSVVNAEIVERLYHHDCLKNVRKKVTLTGFVPTDLLSKKVPAFADRPIDVGYRARRVPYWLGSFAHEKWSIGQRFRSSANAAGLTCDIESDEQKRFYGGAWIQFLSSCKAVLGTESGASVCDFDGTIQQRVEAYTSRYPDATFEEVREKIFADVDGSLTISVISPRCFEAAALRTLMIMYPGSYSGRLEPWKHYVPLERDFSNIGEVFEILRDPQRAQSIVDRAYEEVACNPRNTFRAMVAEFDEVVDQEWPARNFVRVIRTPSLEALQRSTALMEGYLRVRRRAVAALLRTVSFVLENFVPAPWRPTVMRPLRHVWRFITRVV